VATTLFYFNNTVELGYPSQSNALPMGWYGKDLKAFMRRLSDRQYQWFCKVALRKQIRRKFSNAHSMTNAALQGNRQKRRAPELERSAWQ